MSTTSGEETPALSRTGISTPDLLAGGTFVALGAAFAIGGSRYDVGSALKMGSGYVPLMLGIILIGLGALVLISAFRGGDPTLLGVERRPIPWRRAGLLIGAILFFGVFVAALGLGPTLLITTFLAAMAGHDAKPAKAALTAVGITVLCLVVFVGALQLRLPLFGEWLGG